MSYNIHRPLTADERNQIGEISDTLAHLLFHRGVTKSEEAKDFLNPDYDNHTHDPFLFKNIEKSADRIMSAIKNKELIAIYSDYDADGIPAAVIFNDFFNRIGYKNFLIYIPHRHNEGFGLNTDAMEHLAEKGARLIVTLDCGISDIEPVKRAKELGIDVIITDHHEPPKNLPDAYAIVDHKQADCSYPDKNLCGSAVAYKLIQAILKKDRFGLKEGIEKWLLDMVGIATLSDMVPLVGENRVLAHYGLSVLRKSPRKGLQKLLDHLKISQKHLSEDDVTFMITPRINAASRMGVPMDAFHLFATDDDKEVQKHVEHLDHINNERKGVVATLVKEVKKNIKERYGASGQEAMINDQTDNKRLPNVIVMGNPNWRPSLLGLAANTCAEEFNRPTFLWGRDGDGQIKGSCRSGGTVSVVEIMHKVPDGVLTQYGGHFASGGFAVSMETVHHLHDHLNSAFDLLAKEHEEKEPEYIDMEMEIDRVDENFFNEINKLAPFGIANPKPTFLFRNVIPFQIKRFGKNNDHIELSFRKSSGVKIPAISFFGASNDWVNETKEGKPIDLIATVEKSMFRNRPEIRLRIVDVI